MQKKKILNGSLLMATAAFPENGGWIRDSEFILEMGGVYLLAHGLGKPVEDAESELLCTESGEYHIYAYTYNWVAPWHKDMAPGQFDIEIGGNRSSVFGTKAESWGWEHGGRIFISEGINKIRIHDLTGFEGRVAYIFISKEEKDLPTGRDLLSCYISECTENEGSSEFDFIVVGGGFAGMCASLAAARS